MRYDQHSIHVSINGPKWHGGFTQPGGDYQTAERRARDLSEGREVTSVELWVVLERDGIKVTAHGKDETYQEVFERAKRIMSRCHIISQQEHMR